jgi:hypothetical protein
MLQARVEGLEKARRRETFRLRPHGFVTSRAGVARLYPGELPDHPICRFDHPLRGCVNLRRLIEYLPDFWEEPFGTDPAAIAVENAAKSNLAGDGIELIRLWLSGVVFP